MAPADVSHLPLTLGVDEVAHELGVSRRTVYELIAGDPPALRSIKVRGRRVVPRQALGDYLDELGGDDWADR